MPHHNTYEKKQNGTNLNVSRATEKSLRETEKILYETSPIIVTKIQTVLLNKSSLKISENSLTYLTSYVNCYQKLYQLISYNMDHVTRYVEKFKPTTITTTTEEQSSSLLSRSKSVVTKSSKLSKSPFHQSKISYGNNGFGNSVGNKQTFSTSISSECYRLKCLEEFFEINNFSNEPMLIQTVMNKILDRYYKGELSSAGNMSSNNNNLNNNTISFVKIPSIKRVSIFGGQPPPAQSPRGRLGDDRRKISGLWQVEHQRNTVVAGETSGDSRNNNNIKNDIPITNTHRRDESTSMHSIHHSIHKKRKERTVKLEEKLEPEECNKINNVTTAVTSSSPPNTAVVNKSPQELLKEECLKKKFLEQKKQQKQQQPETTNNRQIRNTAPVRLKDKLPGIKRRMIYNDENVVVAVKRREKMTKTLELSAVNNTLEKENISFLPMIESQSKNPIRNINMVQEQLFLLTGGARYNNNRDSTNAIKKALSPNPNKEKSTLPSSSPSPLQLQDTINRPKANHKTMVPFSMSTPPATFRSIKFESRRNGFHEVDKISQEFEELREFIKDCDVPAEHIMQTASSLKQDLEKLLNRIRVKQIPSDDNQKQHKHKRKQQHGAKTINHHQQQLQSGYNINNNNNRDSKIRTIK